MCDLGWHTLLAWCSPGDERHTGHAQWYCLCICLLCDRDFDDIRGEGMVHGGQDMWGQYYSAGVLGKWCFNDLPLGTWSKTKYRFERRRCLPHLAWLIRSQRLPTQGQARHHGCQGTGMPPSPLLGCSRPERPEEWILRKAGTVVGETGHFWSRVSGRSPSEAEHTEQHSA